jgi:hypothetical protein
MRIKTLSLVVLAGLFIGCGDASSIVAEKDENQIANQVAKKSFKVAMDNSVHEVSGAFNNYKVVVYTDGEISDKPSQDTKAIYGKINGKSTASLLTINGNYSDGDVFKVKVYQNNKLVGESDEKVLTGNTLEFSNIDI